MCIRDRNYILKNDSEKASQYLTKFSRLIRLILDHSNQNFITLSSEIQLLKLYIEMEDMRFEKHFETEISVDKNLDAEHILIPSMPVSYTHLDVYKRQPEQRTTIAPTPPNISHGSVSFAGLARWDSRSTRFRSCSSSPTRRIFRARRWTRLRGSIWPKSTESYAI